ncbi:transmembrane protein [Tieghemostelium lacteum]|uniref:Transmembrane protein n=1 Tax=Tieghemostelium lacteum TaxID=361077 RepID=A0A152A0Q3_TIELA|nr:transmembrane protein [Tieghemostelium lacteum]|eukprot:KYQ99696.1 transmembrane protein [Tieghemostelium lacteum]
MKDTDYPPVFLTLWIVAGGCALVAIILSFYLIYKHLRNYTNPDLQKYIVRILFMVPIYSVDSWLSLRFISISLYLDVIRDTYEAYVLYCFFNLIVAVIEKEHDIVELLHSKEPMSHPFPLHCLPKIKLGRGFLQNCKRYVLQFVFVKPIVSIISLVLETVGKYGEGQFTPTKGYMWLTIVENISVSLSLYFLVLYYQAMKDDLKPFKPLGKFLCIKSIIFFSFWQGIAISLLVQINIITPIGDWSVTYISTYYQDFITCIEMLIISMFHHKFFTYHEYRDPNKVPFLYNRNTKKFFSNPSTNIKPVIMNFFTNVKSISSDVITDTKETFILPLISPDSKKIKDEEHNLLNVEEGDVII